MKSTDQLKEELLKQQMAAHALWLDHPTTQLFLKWLKGREVHYTRTLQEGIMLKSDKEHEDRLRSAITTCKAVFLVSSDSELFVRETTKQ